MAYTINKTDGTILATVADGQIDQFSSSLTLIGKNYSGFGEALNENFVKLLENFSGANIPSNPVKGQIWFDTSELKLKVYNGTGFVPVSSATIASSRPGTLGVGDLWFNDVDKQLYFFDGVNIILLGPDYSTSQGLSGVKVSTILDKNNVNRVITLFYTNGVLIGIFAKDEFIPKLAIQGFNNTGEDKIIYPGFNIGNLEGLKFNVTATNAEKLDNIPSANFARRDQANIFSGQVSISSNDGLAIGDGFQALLEVDVGNVILSNSSPNRRLEFKVRRNTDSESAVNIIPITREIKLFEGKSDSLVTVSGSIVVEGNLTVNGETTTVNTTTLAIEDKNIDLAKSAVPTDTGADLGGITLKGTTDHKLYWVYDSATLGDNQANRAWNSTEHVNLVANAECPNPEFKINGITVISANSLGSNITNLPGVTSFGTQTVVNIGPIIPPSSTPTAYIRIENNRISTLQTDQNLELAPNGNGNVELIGSPKIRGLATTNEAIPSQVAESQLVLSASELSEATTKKYVTNLVRTRSIVFSIDVSDSPSNSVIAGLLTQLAPPNEYENGTIARLLCTSIVNNPVNIDINPLISKNNTVEYRTPTGTNFPLQDIAIAPATVPGQAVTVFRVIKTFQLVAGSWAFIS